MSFADKDILLLPKNILRDKNLYTIWFNRRRDKKTREKNISPRDPPALSGKLVVFFILEKFYALLEQ